MIEQIYAVTYVATKGAITAFIKALAIDEAVFVTGKALLIDGGFTVGK